MSLAARSLLQVATLAAVLAWSPVESLPDAAADGEVRALWVLRTSLSSPQSVRTLVQSARNHGFNTLLVQVRGRGDSYYQPRLEPRAAELSRQPESFDPLATVIESA